MMKGLYLLIAVLFSGNLLLAQELNCKVTVTHREIQNVDAKVFKALEKSLNDFMNNQKWTSDIFQANEKIECSILLNITKNPEQNLYSGTLTINASRPVYGTSYSTSLLNYVERDEDFTFRFDESQPLLFDDNRVAGSNALSSNLTAVFAFYAYMILGYDYDSFSPLGGTAMFKKAQNVAFNAPEDGKIMGWKSSERNNGNRYWMIEQLMNPRYEPLREAWYKYHRQGLDLMASKPEEAVNNIMSVLEPVDRVSKETQYPVVVKLFFFSKSLEYQNFLAQVPAEKRQNYIEMLARTDIPNAGKYRSIK